MKRFGRKPDLCLEFGKYRIRPEVPLLSKSLKTLYEICWKSCTDCVKVFLMKHSPSKWKWILYEISTSLPDIKWYSCCLKSIRKIFSSSMMMMMMLQRGEIKDRKSVESIFRWPLMVNNILQWQKFSSHHVLINPHQMNGEFCKWQNKS